MSRETVQKHTPGPWHWWTYTDVDGDPRLDGRAYTVHAFSFKAPTAAWGGYEIGNDDEAKANARLIAAAPDMLAALHVAAETLRSFDPGDPSTETGWKHDELCAAWVQVTDAIAKAEAA